MPDPFPSTHWSVVRRARGRDSDSRRAMGALCEAYWFPLYSYVRRQGNTSADAPDLVQAFLTHLLEKRHIDVVHPEAGRFRAFLLHKLKQFLHNERERRNAAKRGGGVLPFSLDTDSAEHRFATFLADPHAPDDEYEKQWARTVVDRVMARLEAEAKKHGRSARFEVIKGLITDGTRTVSLRDAAARLDMTEAALKTAVHRERVRFGNLLREEVRQTIDPARCDVDAELKYLLHVLERR